MAAAAGTVTKGLPQRAARRPHAARIGLWLALLAIIAGFILPTEQYITPQDGLGYWLGIAGGSFMLLLLIYPIRKRMPRLSVIGSVKLWFRTHMILGVLGPLAILYHANFSLGATNSNVALACMILVASSGLVGRFLYARIHHGLYGQKATLRELADDAESLRNHSGALKVLPGLMDELERAERDIARPASMVMRPVLAGWRERRASRRIRRLVESAVAMAATRSSALSQERERFTRTASEYVAARLRAVRRIAEFEACDRLFAIWHVLHIPLFVVLVIVGVVHVIAVHLY